MNNVTRSSLDYLSKNFHMVGLQETCFTGLRTFKRAKRIWSEASRFNTSFWSQDHMTTYTGHAGVGLLLTPTCPVQDLQDVTLRHVSSSELLQRYLVLRGTLNTVVTYIHVVYAPVQSGDRPTFFDQLPRNFNEGAQHIVMGDFNTVLSSQCDQALHNNRVRLQGRAQLQDWMQELNAVDAWRLQHPTLEEYTSPNSSSRVDYVMMSSQLFHAALRDIRHDFRQSANAGDHCGIKFHLGSATFRPATRAPWRCPEWVIQLPEAQMYLHESLEEFADSIHSPTNAEYNPGCLLDEHMRHDSIFLRELFQSKKNIRQKEIEELHLSINRLRHLQHTEPSANQERTLQEKQETLKVKLKEKEYYASQKKFISDLRSSERCSEFFFRPPQVLHNTPIPVNSKEELDSMCTAFNEYWSGIYKSPSKEYRHVKPKWDRMKMAQILKHTTARLTSAQMAYLDSPFTANEFYGAIKHTTKGKAPGPDGLPLAYYLTDLPLWCRVLEVVYSAQLGRGSMTKFQRRGQVCLLYKKGDRKDPSNYRPITLLNVNAKLGPKILAYRLGTVLDSLLGPDQYGFVSGRDIRCAHLRLQALMKVYESEPSPAGAVLLDFAKAFDSVVWDALDMVLAHFGFGPVFRRWVRVLFPGTLVSLLFNGSPLAPFELGAGVRQGDPLSPGLFVLYVEPLLNLIRGSMRDAGLRCGNSTMSHTIMSFADDCTGLLHDLRDAKRLLDLVDDFCAASGMRLNKSKTVVLPFHPWGPGTEKLRESLHTMGLSTVGNSESTKLLGIYYGPSLSCADRLQHLLANMQTRCSLWKYRARTLHGLVVILQQIVLPVLWYSASVCHVPKTGFQDQIAAMIVRFMKQSSASNAVPQEWWYLPPSMGGLGLASMETFIQGLQLRMLCKLILAVRQSPGEVPSWTEPVIALFDSAMRPWGHDFDILYAPVTTRPDYVVARRLTRWQHLGEFWHDVLFVWNTKLRKRIVRNASMFDKVTTPFLDNVEIRTSGSKPKTLSARHLGIIKFLLRLHLCRPADLFELCGHPLTAASLSRELRQRGASGRVTSEGFCQTFISEIASLLRPITTLPTGPQQPLTYPCAFHAWVFDGYDIEDLSVAILRGLITTTKTEAPKLPIHSLGVEKNPPKDIWSRDIKMNKHVLPVNADLLYRLQHNALYVGFRLQHVNGAATLCHHGCDVVETVAHLFWYCEFAADVWSEWLTVLQRYFDSPIEWGTIVYFMDIVPTEHAKNAFGYSLFVIFHVVRVVVLRCLWTHRNDIRFHGEKPNVIAVKARVHALIDLHVAAFWEVTLLKAIRQSSRVRSQLHALLRELPVTAPFEDDGDPSNHGTEEPTQDTTGTNLARG